MLVPLLPLLALLLLRLLLLLDLLRVVRQQGDVALRAALLATPARRATLVAVASVRAPVELSVALLAVLVAKKPMKSEPIQPPTKWTPS